MVKFFKLVLEFIFKMWLVRSKETVNMKKHNISKRIGNYSNGRENL